MQDTQSLYDFVPLPERKPLKWPNGKRLALLVTLNLEYWELTQDHDGLYFGGGPSINERLLPARIPDFNNHSWREYGHRVGIWRLYDIFDEAKVPASCTVNGILCERHPQIVLAAAKRGYELIAHNYIQTEFMVNYREDRAKEKAVILRVLDLIEKTTGKRPKGWLSSSLRCTVNTSDICKELGLTYHCDYMNDEQPYLIKTAHGPLVSAPYTQEANDIGMFLRRNLTADEAFGLWKDEFDELYRAGEKSGRMMSIGLHPTSSGVRSVLEPSANFSTTPRSSTACGGPPARKSRIGIYRTTVAISVSIRRQRSNVMAGLVPAIHVFICGQDVDARHEARCWCP